MSVLLVTLSAQVTLPGVAAAAGDPSVELPVIQSTKVTEQRMLPPRAADQATSDSVHGNQSPPSSTMDGAGTPTATTLTPSSTWDLSAHTGDFSWSYPLRVPPAPGGLAPNLALSYRSSAVDGHTSATNNQPSWIGDGWDLSPGFVERTYGACATDTEGGFTPPQVGDLCWRSDNATASYSGGGGMLIRDDHSGIWHPKHDDGSRVEQLTGAGNGDDNGEYWRITTVDGTQYLFGSQPSSNSTWTVPVFGDDNAEPCHGSTFDTSHCVQGWRWNLDKVIDRHGNVVRYFYDTESNSYAMNRNDAAVSYIRGGTLARVEYGLRDDSPNVAATGKIVFTPADRCVPGSPCALDNKANWPDTPLDNRCDTATCHGHPSPTFWSTKRLATITTQVLRGSTYTDVDRWTLDQQYPDPGDGENAALWLKAITHTGLVGGSISMPAITFEGAKMANRVYHVDGYSPLNRYRITGIVTETGGLISINYAPPECVFGATMPASPQTNTLRCFPQQWTPKGQNERTDYFHKYVVAQIVQSDRLSSSTSQVTNYEYLDGAAWHKNQSEFVHDDKKTWDEFRGFGRVRIRTGTADDPAGPVTLTEQRFYSGMDGDTHPVTLTDSEGGQRTDSDWLDGIPFESTTYNGVNGPVVTKTLTDPIKIGPTATRGPFNAYIVRTGTERTYTALASGGWRTTRTDTTYDDRGIATRVNDLGDIGTSTDDRCVRTTYVRNDATWVLNLHARVEVVSVNCDTTPVFPDNAISDSRTSYDGHAPGAIPTAGDPTRIEIAGSHLASADPVYVTISTARYDAHGRAVETTDALGNTSSIGFTPAIGGPVTQSTATTPPTLTVPNGLAVSSTLEPAFGSPTTTTDANGFVTEMTYDALGRTTEVWLPDRPRADNPQGNAQFSYAIHNDALSVVTTTSIGPNGNYVSSNTLLDGLLRTRQVQTPAEGGGRLLTDTRYDSHGRAYKSTQPFFNDAAVDTKLWEASDTEVPGLTRTEFDGAGRPTAAIYQAGAAEKWRTTTTYGGDRVSVTPPPGGTATTTITDARGQTTELRQYQASTPTGAFDATRYAYTQAGQLSTLTDPAGNIWQNNYDLRGRVVNSVDPDRGPTDLTYNDANQPISTTDARGITLVQAYDRLGRPTKVNRDSATGPKLAEWTYDTAPGGLGKPATSTRFVGDNAYTTKISSYDEVSRPNGVWVTIPAAEGGLAGTYKTYFSYNPDGSPSGRSYAAGGGLAAETVNYTYDNLGNLRTSSGAHNGTVELVTDTSYTRYGEQQQIQLGEDTKRTWLSSYYDTNTRQLTRQIVDSEVASPMLADVNYTYDPAGNVTSISDTKQADTQCFRLDYLRRLTEAWTPANGCAANPSTAGLGGPAAYWTSFTYDKTGNRTAETQHAAGGDTQRVYTYPPHGHQLSSITTKRPGRADTTDSYSYDANGNTVTEPGGTLAWDAEDHLASVTGNGQTTSFIYTADGGRLLRKDPSGTTLYLNGEELRLATGASTPTCTRYYTYGSRTIAVRQGDTLTWLAGDHQGSAELAINSDTQQATVRRQTPFGAARGTPPAWPGEHGFLGGTQDPSTKLTHLGAREYDPSLGRFISVDPILDVGDPQQFNGYAYSDNNPTTFSDPSGLYSCIDLDCRHHAPPPVFVPPPISSVGSSNPVVVTTGAAPPSNGHGSTGGQGPSSTKSSTPQPIPSNEEANGYDQWKKQMDSPHDGKCLAEFWFFCLAYALTLEDPINCAFQHDVGACVSTAVSVVTFGFGKVFGKAIGRAVSAIDDVLRGIKDSHMHGIKPTDFGGKRASVGGGVDIQAQHVQVATGSRLPIDYVTCVTAGSIVSIPCSGASLSMGSAAISGASHAQSGLDAVAGEAASNTSRSWMFEMGTDIGILPATGAGIHIGRMTSAGLTAEQREWLHLWLHDPGLGG